MDTAIRTLNLTKYYGRHQALADVDLEVAVGEVFGFLGPNGAGKSTTIRLLLDLLRPTSGSASVLGLEPRAAGPALRRRIGYLPGDLALYPNLTGRQLCSYFASLRGLDTTTRVAELAERFHLDLDRTIADYSTGNRQKVGLVQAFMHDPELLILDEPTAGLDPLMQQEFHALVAETRAMGRTVFLSSHVLPEVEQVADRVAIIRDGEVVVTEEVATLKQRAIRRLEFDFAHAVEEHHFLGLASVVSATAGHDGRHLILEVQGSIDEVVKVAAGFEVLNLVSHDGDLEDVFLAYYRGDAAGADLGESVAVSDDDSSLTAIDLTDGASEAGPEAASEDHGSGLGGSERSDDATGEHRVTEVER